MSSSISSSTGLSPRLAASVAARQPLGNYERNAKAFGPVAANVIGVAEAAGYGVSTVCTLSREGLAELGQAAESVYEGASQAVEAIGETVASVASAVGDAAGSVASYAALGALAGSALINELA